MPTPVSAGAAATVPVTAATAATLRARHEAELRTSMTTSQETWAQGAEDSTATFGNPYTAAVPHDTLEHPGTDIETLKEYCRGRGITFGERPSLQVLRDKLKASNADVQTVWSL